MRSFLIAMAFGFIFLAQQNAWCGQFHSQYPDYLDRTKRSCVPYTNTFGETIIYIEKAVKNPLVSQARICFLFGRLESFANGYYSDLLIARDVANLKLLELANRRYNQQVESLRGYCDGNPNLPEGSSYIPVPSGDKISFTAVFKDLINTQSEICTELGKY